MIIMIIMMIIHILWLMITMVIRAQGAAGARLVVRGLKFRGSEAEGLPPRVLWQKMAFSFDTFLTPPQPKKHADLPGSGPSKLTSAQDGYVICLMYANHSYMWYVLCMFHIHLYIYIYICTDIYILVFHVYTWDPRKVTAMLRTPFGSPEESPSKSSKLARVFIHIYIYICMYVCMYVYIYIYI